MYFWWSYFVIAACWFGNCRLLKDISLNTKCLRVWWDQPATTCLFREIFEINYRCYFLRFIPNGPPKPVTASNNWIFLISVVLSLVFVVVVVYLFLLELEIIERWFFQRVYLYRWAAARHKLSTLSTWAHSFNSWLISQFITNFVNNEWFFFIDD